MRITDKRLRSLGAFFDSRRSHEPTMSNSHRRNPDLRQIAPAVDNRSITIAHGVPAANLLEFASGTKGSRTPRDAVPQPPRFLGTARGSQTSLRSLRNPSANPRSPLGVPLRLSLGGCHLPTQLQAMLPGTRRERTILWTAFRRRPYASPRALPRARLSQSRVSTPAPVIMPEG
jgi:hypothetical protein